MSQYSQNGRTGSFLAVNNGTIEGCIADIAFSCKNISAGFVYENNAQIVSSASVKCIKGKSAKGFYVRNGGTITASGYIAGKGALKIGKDGKRVYVFGNEEQFIAGDTPTESIRLRLELDKLRRGTEGKGFVPDMKANRKELPVTDSPAIRIETADDLKMMIESVNSGDKKAAGAHYILAGNINMKGAKLKPIGDCESYPFSGTFDGNGYTVSNFTIDCRGAEYGGFFGCTKNANVANLALDYILKGKGGVNIGGMAGSIAGGSFENCQVRIAMSPGLCSGGFCGKNTGYIRNCYVGGKIAQPAPILPWLIPSAAILLVLLTVGSVVLVQKLTGNVPFRPEIIDPNQVPVPKPNQQEDPPPAGTNRISLELNHEVYVSATTMVGQMDYVNPHRSTQDVVIRLCISDAELKKAGYDLVACKVRTQKELNAEGYDPEKAFTVLYSSQRLQIGYKLGYCKLSALPNGETLKVGDYEMIMMIDAYDPKTNEKAIVNAQAMTTIHVVDR